MGGPLWPCVYLAPLARYSASKIMGSQLWPFWGHVTSSVTWPFDSAYVVSYWWSIVTMRLTCTVREIWTLKLAFAHVKGQKFTELAPCHVTCRQGVQNNHIFGIPEATLPIHYATLVGLRWRLRVVCRWASPLLSVFSCNCSKSENGFRIYRFGGIKGEIWKMNVETPLRNQSPPKHVIQCKECGDIPKNVFSRAWQEKYKNERNNKKNPFLNVIFYPFALLTLLGRFVPFLACRVRPLT